MLQAKSALAVIIAALCWAGCAVAPPETDSTGGGGEGGSGATGGSASGGSAATGGSATAGAGGSDGIADGPPCQVTGAAGVCIDIDKCTSGGVAIPGYCPGPFEIKCCVHDEVTCDPSSQVLPNGGLAEAPGSGGCPAGMLRAGSFCVDRFEASLETLDGKPWSPYFNPGDSEVRARSIEGAVPQGYINAIQAAAACANAGKRLCTDDEWLRACRGPKMSTYPYGDDDGYKPGTCNDARSEHPAIEYFGTADDWIWSELGNACVSQLPASLDRTGENPGCVSADGAYDMMGNLHEWTAAPDGTFRGGYYVDTTLNGPGCLYKTTAHNTAYWDYSTGFRCCADAP